MRMALLAATAAFCAQALDEPDIRSRATKSVALLQRTAAQWKTPCVSCHHQALVEMALDSARRHGVAVDAPAAQAAGRFSFRFLADLDEAVQVHNIIDPAVSEGYALRGADAAGIAPNLTTAVYARHIARNQRADGSWPSFDARPPQSSASPVHATASAVYAVTRHLPKALERERKERAARAARWLAAASPASTDDAVFRLFGLHWAGAPPAAVRGAGAALSSLQRADGGWGQVPEMRESDAYSTAEALAALRQSGVWARDAAGFARGVQWLVSKQRADGSWHVKTRIHTKAPVSPPYFESGFPHGKDQFISCAATAWAVAAFAEALPEAANPARPLAIPEAAPATKPWMETALFGPAADVTKLDPALATEKGTTVLMMASANPDAVRALLRKGANAKAAAKSGYDALMVASLFPGNAESLRALIAAGASPKPREGVKYKASALPLAAVGGDPEMARVLIDAGAQPDHPFQMLGQFAASPFAIAVGFEHAALMKLLAAKGAAVDATDEFGMTQVSWSALQHKPLALGALLSLGAKREVRDKFGMTPLEHTKSIDFSEPESGRMLTAR